MDHMSLRNYSVRFDWEVAYWNLWEPVFSVDRELDEVCFTRWEADKARYFIARVSVIVTLSYWLSLIGCRTLEIVTEDKSYITYSRWKDMNMNAQLHNVWTIRRYDSHAYVQYGLSFSVIYCNNRHPFKVKATWISICVPV